MASALADAASRLVRAMPKVGSLPYHSKSLPAYSVAGSVIPGYFFSGVAPGEDRKSVV